MAFDASRLTPIKIFFCNKSIWRVPLYKPIDGDYTLFVNTGFTRTFTDKTLPRSLKSSIAMILASDYQYLSSDEEVNEYNVFTAPLGVDVTWFNIGWKISPSWFCMCMQADQITSLKGIINENIISNSNDDDNYGS
jgi:hypothetical protein